MNKICSLWYYGLVLGILMVGVVPESTAGIAVEPTVTEVAVEQGAVLEKSYTVMNTGTEEIQVTIELVDWLKEFVGKTGTADLASWLSFPEKTFVLGGGETCAVPYTITVPKKLDSEQVAQVFFAFAGTGGEQQSFRTRLGVILYLGIAGKEQLKAEITDYTVHAKKNEAGRYDVTAKLAIENKGNVHIRPSGKVRITKHREEVAVIPIRAGKGIYAGLTELIYGSEENLALKPGTYTVYADINCSMYGIYYAIQKKTKMVVS